LSAHCNYFERVMPRFARRKRAPDKLSSGAWVNIYRIKMHGKSDVSNDCL